MGWVELPNDYDKDEFARIKAAQRIRENSDVLIVIGIGGSYLGARAAIESLNHSFTICFPRISEMGLRFTLQVTILAQHILLS